MTSDLASELVRGLQRPMVSWNGTKILDYSLTQMLMLDHNTWLDACKRKNSGVNQMIHGLHFATHAGTDVSFALLSLV